jgi:hypothetical protein
LLADAWIEAIAELALLDALIAAVDATDALLLAALTDASAEDFALAIPALALCWAACIDWDAVDEILEMDLAAAEEAEVIAELQSQN